MAAPNVVNLETVRSLRNLLGSVISRFALTRRFGASTHGGARDLYNVFGYEQTPTFINYLHKYTRQDVAGRIIDAPAAALWSNPPDITSNNNEWNTAWNNIVTRNALFPTLERLDKLAGLGPYAVLLIGFAKGGSLSSPIPELSLQNLDKPILYFQAYNSEAAEIQKLNDINTSERFMLPEMYQIKPQASARITQATSVQSVAVFQAHSSRVLHVCENPLEDEIYGSGRLERVYNLLDDLLKVAGGTAETFWLTSNRGLHINVDKELEVSPEDAKDLSDEVNEYVNQLRRVIRTRGVDVQSLGAETPDPRGAFEILIALLSGATGIPRRILTGSEAGQLASDQDRANWAERIGERRKNWAEPMILYPLIKKLTYAGALPVSDDLQITITWPSAFVLSPLEQAQTSAQHARSAANFAKMFDTFARLNEPKSAGFGSPGNKAVGPGTSRMQADPTAMPTKQPAQPTQPQAPEAPPQRSMEEIMSDAQTMMTIDEARKFMTLDKPLPTYDSGKDVL